MLPLGRVRAADVAKAAGVSVATVSYALNQTPGQRISRETADRVRATAKELGYVRNRSAQDLARGDSRLVVIDLSHIPTGPAAENGTHEFNTRIQDLGYTAVQGWWGPQPDHEKLLRLVGGIGATRVLTALPVADATRDALHAVGVRTISSLIPQRLDLPTVVEGSAFAQVEHLAARGHSHVLYSGGFNPISAEVSGLHQALARRSAEGLGVTFESVPASSSLEDHSTKLVAALSEHPSTTAILTSDDMVALQALSALSGVGISVPDDVAVIGTGNFPFAPYTDPPLTSVAYSYHLERLPEDVFELMLEGPGVDGLAAHFGDAIVAEVIPRQSC